MKELDLGEDIRTVLNCGVTALVAELRRLDKEIPEQRIPRNDAYSRRFGDAMEQARAFCHDAESQIGCNPVQLAAARRFVRQSTRSWFDRSWFLERARTKPRGYPGDFELLEAMYEGEPRATGLGGYIDFYFLGNILCRGVRARMALMRELILNELTARPKNVTVLDIASGSCRELREISETIARREPRLTCIDRDRAALAWAERALQETGLAKSIFAFRDDNILRMSNANWAIRTLGQFDIIYSIGLCDYLNDDILIRLLGTWREMLSAGGKLFVSFKDSSRYDRTEYEWFADWYFQQRRQGDCEKLFEAAGFHLSETILRRDSTGVMMLFEFAHA